MTKDEIIAQLIADKQELVRLLQMALGPKPLGASTERTRRYRERHGDGHSDAEGTSRERHRGDIGGQAPPSSSTSLPETDQETNEDDVGVVKGKRNVTVTEFKNSDFEVTQELLEWAQANLMPELSIVELRNGTLEFSEYWQQQPTKRSLPGWERTWKNRMIELSGRLARAS